VVLAVCRFYPPVLAKRSRGSGGRHELLLLTAHRWLHSRAGFRRSNHDCRTATRRGDLVGCTQFLSREKKRGGWPARRRLPYRKRSRVHTAVHPALDRALPVERTLWGGVVAETVSLEAAAAPCPLLTSRATETDFLKSPSKEIALLNSRQSAAGHIAFTITPSTCSSHLGGGGLRPSEIPAL